MPPHPPRRDILVIGASAGGVDALRLLVGGLPGDLAAAVFVVLHLGESSHLPAILDKAGPLPVGEARNGEPVESGRVYVAAPDLHLLLHDGHVLLRRGPRENRARPAIDPLFRSAALAFGGRVIGVVLTGRLDDGTAGLRAVRRCGGLAVVQDPEDAAFPDMPASALRHAGADHVAGIAGMAALLRHLVGQPSGPSPAETPVDLRLETLIASQEPHGMGTNDELGTPSPFTCPECQGVLWEIAEGDILRYRCHVGHAFTAASALAGHDDEIGRMLERMVRSHNERAALTRRLIERERRDPHSRLLRHLESRAEEYERDAQLVQNLFDGQVSPVPAAPGERRREADAERQP